MLFRGAPCRYRLRLKFVVSPSSRSLNVFTGMTYLNGLPAVTAIFFSLLSCLGGKLWTPYSTVSVLTLVGSVVALVVTGVAVVLVVVVVVVVVVVLVVLGVVGALVLVVVGNVRISVVVIMGVVKVLVAIVGNRVVTATVVVLNVVLLTGTKLTVCLVVDTDVCSVGWRQKEHILTLGKRKHYQTSSLGCGLRLL